MQKKYLKMSKPTLLLSLDVESYGILGQPFSYGIVVSDLNTGETVAEIYEFSSASLVDARKSGINQWVEDNVVSVAGETTLGFLSVEQAFLTDWEELLRVDCNYIWCADHPHPVESLFISNVMKMRSKYGKLENKSDLELSPYPLLDINSIRWSLGLSTTFDRLSNELPVHHPLMDARQSLRGLYEAIDRATDLGIKLQF